MILSSASTIPGAGPPALLSRSRLLVVHRGALGDFLNAWPSLLALRRAFPNAALTCSAPVAHLALARRIGLPPASAEDERDFPLLFGHAEPPTFRDAAILWFGLTQAPRLAHGNMLFLPGLIPGDSRPPRDVWMEGLARLGAPAAPDWQEVWRRSICRAAGPSLSRLALIFPGAGHPAKAWPLPRWLDLAAWLATQSWEPLFVLGPQEIEQGMTTVPWPAARPETVDDLLELMRRAALALGGDTGPMHLASLCGLPGVVLFGPTSARQWGPPGLTILRGHCPRRPCTVTTAGLACADPLCLPAIEQAAVRQAVRDICPVGPP